MPYVGEDFLDTDPLETKAYSFNFADVMDVGEGIISQVWTVSVLAGYGVDPTPMARIVGGFTTAGTVVTQKIGNLVGGARYEIMVTVHTSVDQVLNSWSFVNSKAIP